MWSWRRYWDLALSCSSLPPGCCAVKRPLPLSCAPVVMCRADTGPEQQDQWLETETLEAVSQYKSLGFCSSDRRPPHIRSWRLEFTKAKEPRIGSKCNYARGERCRGKCWQPEEISLSLGWRTSCPSLRRIQGSRRQDISWGHITDCISCSHKPEWRDTVR